MTRSIFLVIVVMLGCHTECSWCNELVRTPYQVDVHVKFESDPSFTRLLVSRVESQINDLVQNYFGPLTKLSVITADSKLPQLNTMDLSQLQLTPRDYESVSLKNRKVFLVRIAQTNGVYTLSWQQIDGTVQWASPVRSAEVVARNRLGKALSTVITEQFGLVAEIGKDDKGNLAVNLQGSEIDKNRRIPEIIGEMGVFQPFRVLDEGNGNNKVEPIRWTFIRTTRQFGETKVVVESGLSTPLKTRSQRQRIMAIRLNTQPGRFCLRLLDKKTDLPVQDFSVRVGTTFDNTEIVGFPNVNGLIESDGNINHLACVQLKQATTTIDIPIALTTDYHEETCRVPVNPLARQADTLKRELRYLQQDLGLFDSLHVRNVREINQLNSNKEFEKALSKAKSTLDELSAGRSEIERSIASLQQIPGFSQQSERVIRRLSRLKSLETAMKETVDNLQRLVEKYQAQQQADTLRSLAKQAEQNGDYGEALERYQAALQEQPDQADLVEYIAELTEVWTIKNDSHQEAHDFVFDEWSNPDLEPDEVKSLLPQARQTLETFKKNGDYLRPQKLIRLNVHHQDSLNAYAEFLDNRDQDEVREKMTEINTVIQELQSLNDQITDYVTSQISE